MRESKGSTNDWISSSLQKSCSKKFYKLRTVKLKIIEENGALSSFHLDCVETFLSLPLSFSLESRKQSTKTYKVLATLHRSARIAKRIPFNVINSVDKKKNESAKISAYPRQHRLGTAKFCELRRPRCCEDPSKKYRARIGIYSGTYRAADRSRSQPIKIQIDEVGEGSARRSNRASFANNRLAEMSLFPRNR